MDTGQGTHLHDLKSLYSAGIWDMRSTAKINERSTSIDGGAGPVWNFFVDEVQLVLAVTKHLLQVGFGHLEALKRLFFLDGFTGNDLQLLPIGLLHDSTGTGQIGSKITGLSTYASGMAMS